jgi:hypothetical protein
MSTWLDSIMSPLNAAGQGIEKLIETRDLIKFGDELRKLHAEILAAQRGAMTAQANEATLLEQVSKLKKQVTDLEAWETEKQRYELVALAPNVMAYSVKPAARGTEPPHYICANCYNVGRKSFLNQIVQGRSLDRYKCGNCDEVLSVTKGDGSPRSALVPGRGGGPNSWMR